MSCCTLALKPKSDPFQMKWWYSAGKRIENVSKHISPDDPAWDRFWEAEITRQKREYRSELAKYYGCERLQV